jgi:hypothetical protein
MTSAFVQTARHQVSREWFLYLATFVLTSLTTVWALKLWKADFSVPFAYQSDAVLGVAGFKTLVETGWYETQPLLNAPHGQVFHDWKIADSLGYLFAKVAAVFTQDASVILNTYYVLGFVLAGLTALWFLRLVGVSRTFSVILAVLYAIAPYHFSRGETHLFLASYFPLPLALGLVYLIMRGRPIWGRGSRPQWWGWMLSPTVRTLLVLAMVACANSYYAVFVILLIAISGLIGIIRDRSWKAFGGAVVAGVLTAVFMLANMFPDMLYSWTHGSNVAAVSRTPAGVEVYQLKLVQLLLPSNGHRIDALASLRLFYDTEFPLPSESPSLGFIAAFGFLSLLGIGLYFGVGRLRNRGPGASLERRDALGALSVLTIFAFLLGTVGGLSTLVGLITSDLRGWNRISIVIALFSLAAVGLILDAALSALRKRRFMARTGVATGTTVVLAAGLLIVGYLDQVTSVAEPNYAASAAAFDSDAALVSSIAAAVGDDASIVQLPYRAFPESAPVNEVPDSDQLKPYLHSSTLSWTGGGIKGRPDSEWTRWLEELPAADLVQSAAAAGFEGILIDIQQYGSNTEVIEGVREQLGDPVISTPDGRYEFYDLTPALTAAEGRFSPSELSRVGEFITNPVLARLEPDPQRGLNVIDKTKPYRPQLLIENPRDTPVEIEVKFTVANSQGRSTLRFTGEDGSITEAVASATPRVITIPYTAPVGRSYIDISVISGLPLPQLVSPVIQMVEIDTKDLALLDLLDRG